MDPDVKAAFKAAVDRTVRLIAPLVAQAVEPCWIWRREGDGSWRGVVEPRPSLASAFLQTHPQIAAIGGDLHRLLTARHRDHAGAVGVGRTGFVNVAHDPSQIPTTAAFTLWERHQTFDLPDGAIDGLADEFERFIDRPTVRFRVQTPLLNFHSSLNTIELPAGLRIRRMTEDEVTEYRGGPIHMSGLGGRRMGGIDEFVLEGEFDEAKVFPTNSWDAERDDPIRGALDRAVLCLRTFKAGRVGYDYVRRLPVEFCPVPTGNVGYGDLHVPIGSYELGPDEVEPFCQHAALLFPAAEPAMDMACSRLADAETRIRPQDKIVDAVVGMEALLLAGLRSDDRRGELKTRFSLHYSTLFGTPEERHQQYRVAKDLYDLRSAIAHGSGLSGDSHRVGVERLSLAAAATRATEALRKVVQHFLPEVGETPYKRPEFWERAYFGLP